MTTAHLGEAGPHTVLASTAGELLNKSDNERSGLLPTAMSFWAFNATPLSRRSAANATGASPIWSSAPRPSKIGTEEHDD